MRPRDDTLYSRAVTAPDIGRIAVLMDDEFLAHVVSKLRPTARVDVFTCRVSWPLGPSGSRCMVAVAHDCRHLQTITPATAHGSDAPALKDMHRVRRTPAAAPDPTAKPISYTPDPHRKASPECWIGASEPEVRSAAAQAAADTPLEIDIDEFTAQLEHVIETAVDFPDVTTVADLRTRLGVPAGDQVSSDDSASSASSDGSAPSAASNAAVPPPAPPSHAAARGGRGRGRQSRAQRAAPVARPLRQKRGVQWGLQHWRIARIMRNLDNGEQVHIGWGGTCKQHSNEWDDIVPDPDTKKTQTVCKKALIFADSGMTSEEAELRMKHWLIAGTSIACDDPAGRMTHLAMNPRTLMLLTDDQLLAQLP